MKDSNWFFFILLWAFLGIVFFLLVPIAFAVEPGVPYTIFKLDHCYGELLVKVNTVYNLSEEEMNIPNCNKGENGLWNCDCNELKSIILETKNDTENIYNFKLQYYIEDINNKTDLEKYQAQRIENINNIEVKKELKEEEFYMPPIENVWIVAGVIGIISIFFVTIIVIVWKLLTSNKKDKIQGVDEPKNNSDNAIKELEAESLRLDGVLKDLEGYKKFIKDNKK